MFKIIKEYIWLLDKFNNEINIKKLKEIENKIKYFTSTNLEIKILNIWEYLIELDVKFPIWIYIDYYKKDFIKQENIIYNHKELNNFLEKNRDNIIKVWWLNCYLCLNNWNSFLQLHYQDNIIVYNKL